MDWLKYGPLIAALTAVMVASLAALFTYINLEVQKSRKRKDLYRLLKAEITNLERHCRISSVGLSSATIKPYPHHVALAGIGKYKDGDMLLFDTKESYLLNENLCQDVMQISLFSRNNDIFINELVIEMRAKIAVNEIMERADFISKRLQFTAGLCAPIIKNLDDLMKNSKSYKNPTINW